MAWKLNSETVTVLGWAPAILMQFAHPLVAAGVGGHSVAVAQPDQRLHRLNRTIAAMLALTFGTEEEVARAAAGINRIHDRVHGVLDEAVGPFAAGTRYSAHDPELLRWVHCTLLYTLPRAYDLYVGPLTPAERDRYCLEASGIAPLLGMPEGYLPASTAALDTYLREMLASGRIVISPTARELARELVAPSAPLWARFLGPFTRLPALGLMHPAIRARYGFRWTRRHELALRAGAGALRRAIALMPSWLHHWPAARAGFRRAVAGGPMLASAYVEKVRATAGGREDAASTPADPEPAGEAHGHANRGGNVEGRQPSA